MHSVAAEDRHVLVLAVVDGAVVLGEEVALHQIHAGQVLVRGIDPVELLAGNPQEARQPGAGRDEDRVVAFPIHQLVDDLLGVVVGGCHVVDGLGLVAVDQEQVTPKL